MKHWISIRREDGQATVEYLVVGAGLVAVMFFVQVDGKSFAMILADAVRQFFSNLTFFISLP